MKRTIIRFQLFLLLLAVGLIAYRAIEGTPPPAGTLVLSGLDENSLAAHTLRVTGEPQRFAIEAVGSFATPDAEKLEAYAWLLDRDTREVVWQMTPEKATRTRGTVAEVRDTIMLGPGTYDAFFTSYGSGERPASSGLFSTSRRWRNNASHWKLILNALGDKAFVQSDEVDREDLAPRVPGLLWSTAPDRGNEATTTLLVREPARVKIHAVGAFTPTGTPAVRITPPGASTPVWSLPMAETQEAGGSMPNRQYTGEVQLQPGIYQVFYSPPQSRGWGRWQTNPPPDPGAWGVTLSSPDSNAVVRFAPYETSQPVIAILRPGNHVNRYAAFRVDQPTPVYVYALGEMTGANSRYDYGWIETSSGQRVWEMEYDDTERAGGGSKNRLAEAWVMLEPGTYRLRYRSDDSHSYGSFNTDEPDHSERWGIALFSVAASKITVLDAGNVADSQENRGGNGDWDEEPETPDAVAIPLAPPPPVDGALVTIRRTGNNASISESVQIKRTGDYHLYALGEIVGSGRYDFATLRDEAGKIVWEMTEENTVSAGGARRNRAFDGTIRLEAGRYTLHYETDSNHAYGDFTGSEAPNSPEAWGVVLRPAGN